MSGQVPKTPTVWQEICKSAPQPPVRRRFGFPRQDQLLGLPVGKHVIMKGSTAQGDVIKPYTPVTDVKQQGFVDFVIKVYPEGRMSQHLDKMEPGDELLFKGPRGAFEYKANSQKAIGKQDVSPHKGIRILQHEPLTSAYSHDVPVHSSTQMDIAPSWGQIKSQDTHCEWSLFSFQQFAINSMLCEPG